MPPLPHELGPYRLEKALGRGGMGIVFDAYDQRLDRRVAVKFLLRDSADPRRRERLRREARTTAKLAHPAIVQIFDLVEDDDGVWIVMEKIDGTPLSELSKQGPLDVDTVLGFARQIAEGLAAAHRVGVVHRDLKQENVMIQPDGRVKILDFGIAKQVGLTFDPTRERDLSKTGEIVGTGRVMSPEQARGLEVGPRSDLFSFGVLVYELLSGVSPFRADTPLDTLARVVGHHPMPLDERAPDLPEGLSGLVEHLLRKAPELRPKNAEEVEKALGRLIADRSGNTPPSPVVDDPDTLTAGETLEAPSDRASHRATDHSSESVFQVPASGLPRAVAVFLGLLVTVGSAWWITTGGSSDSERPLGGAEAERAAALPGDSFRTYDEAWRSLAGIQGPDQADRAVEVFRRMIEENPDSAAAHAGLARAYWEKSRRVSGGGDPVFLDQAAAMAREAVRLNLYLADARVALGLVLYSQGRLDEAREELEKTLELEPKHADAFYGLGKLEESQGRHGEAEGFYRRAMELRPAPLYGNALGALLYDQGRYEDAEQAFLGSLAVAPDDLHALRNLGAVYHALDLPEEAAAQLQAALRIRPDASLFSNLGTLYFSRGLYSKAAAAFEDALRQDGAANRHIFWLNLADAYRQLPGRAEEAERAYRRAIQILDDLVEAKPGDVRLRSRRALASVRSGSCDDARRDLDVLRPQGTGDDLYSLFRLAVAEELCGERERALEAVEKALAAGFSLAEVRHEPDLTALRADPRFHHLLVALDEGP